jgi:hypothetical protein
MTEIRKTIQELKTKKHICRIYITVDSVEKYIDGFILDTSQHIHSNFLNLMFGSYVQVIESDVPELEEFRINNLGGLINTQTKQNFKNVIMYDSISYMIILILIIEKHKLFLKKLDKDVDHLVVLSKFNWDLLKHALK